MQPWRSIVNLNEWLDDWDDTAGKPNSRKRLTIRSKSQRDTFLHKWIRISILASDVVTVAEMENTIISEFEEKLLDMHRCIDDLNIQVKQRKAKKQT